MIRPALLAAVAFVFTPHAAPAAPTIANVSLRGLQIGETTTLVIDGSELSGDVQAVLDAPLARQEVQPGATDKRVEIALTLDARARPGVYTLRLVTPGGVSNGVAMGVDHLAQQPFFSHVESLPVAMSGALAGSQILETTFAGMAGQRVVIDVEAARLGAKLRPVVRLHDARGVQLAWSQPQRKVGGDVRIETVLPADGQYTVRLHDLLYRGPAPGFFRLKIGDLHYADMAFPLGAQRGRETEITFFSTSLPADATSRLAPQDFRPGPYLPAPLPAVPGLTGAQPPLVVSDFPELTETPAAGGALQTLPQPPVAVSGRLALKGEEDRYLLEAAPGTKIRVSVLARQVGSPLDGVLTVRTEQGQQLAANDDRPGRMDPELEFEAPAEGKVIVALRDLLRRGGEEFIYRIVAQTVGQPQFSLSLEADRFNVPAGATQVVRVQAQRECYNGPIELALDNPPLGVAAAGTTIAAGETIGLLTLTAAPDAAARGVASIIGRAADGKTEFTTVALAPQNELASIHPWMQDDVAYAVATPAPIAVKWELSEPGRLILGGKTPIQVSVERKDDQVGPVRVRLLTTQVPPKKKEKKNNREVEVDDLDRTLRLADEAMIPANAGQGVFEIATPADLPVKKWGVVLVADALAADGKTVLSTVATPTRRLKPLAPIKLELAGPAAIEAKAGAGDTGRFVGKVVRRGGYAQPVSVTLEGLPQGYPAPKVELSADQSEFALPVSFPYGAAPGSLEGVKLVASSAPNPEKPSAVLRSEPVAVAIKVVPGEMPPAEPPLPVFEDDPQFVEQLSKGGGQISLVEEEKYAGKAAVKVTPDQRYNETVPSLGVKIRENPGPGEYRYLRFAWKKQGGQSICLQLNHDGQWGPQDASRPNAKFRYHAGPGGECYGASLLVNQELPEDWTVVTRDLFADFGEFTFSGLALSAIDGEAAFYDHIYLGRSPADFELVQP